MTEHNQDYESEHEHNHDDEDDRWIGENPPEPRDEWEKQQFAMVDWARCICGQWMDAGYVKMHVFEFECIAPIVGDELI
jgi:hypothetical protein